MENLTIQDFSMVIVTYWFLFSTYPVLQAANQRISLKWKGRAV